MILGRGEYCSSMKPLSRELISDQSLNFESFLILKIMFPDMTTATWQEFLAKVPTSTPY